MGEFNQSKYINQFIKEKYDRINLFVKSGKKEVIKKEAEKRGQSMNEFINSLIDKELNNE